MPALAIAAEILLATEDTSNGSDGSVLGFLPLLILIVGVYFLVAGPQRRRMKASRQAQQDLRESLSFGDEIVTIGGIHGRVTAVAEDDVTIDIGGGTEMRVAKRAIAERAGDDAE